MPPKSKGSEFALRALRRVSQAQALKRASSSGEDRKGSSGGISGSNRRSYGLGSISGSGLSQPLFQGSQRQLTNSGGISNNNSNINNSSNNYSSSSQGPQSQSQQIGGGRQNGCGSQGNDLGFSDSQGNYGCLSQSQTCPGEPSWEKGGWNSSMSTQTPSNLGQSELSQSASQGPSQPHPTWLPTSQPSTSQQFGAQPQLQGQQPLFGMQQQQQYQVQESQSQQPLHHHPQQYSQQQQQAPAQQYSQQPTWMSQPVLQRSSQGFPPSQGFGHPQVASQQTFGAHFRQEASPPYALPESQNCSSQPTSQDVPSSRWALETIPGAGGYGAPLAQHHPHHQLPRGGNDLDENSSAVAKAAAALVAALGQGAGQSLQGDDDVEVPKRRRLRQKGPDPQAHLYRPPSPIAKASEWTTRRKVAVTSLDRRGREAFQRQSAMAVDDMLAQLKKTLHVSTQEVLKSAAATHEGSEEVAELLRELDAAVAENDEVLEQVMKTLNEALTVVPVPAPGSASNQRGQGKSVEQQATATSTSTALPLTLLGGPTLGLQGLRRRRIDGVTAGCSGGR
mmetsp:Transcript_10669/g.23524  ORF Transcript_10669/g.23524 Transcript_10669/m.23524 type:complete len:563 (+) Transcript_10669:349-2037(+)